jgi:hypothetical protein
MTAEIRTWSGDNTACDTLRKRERKSRQSRRGPGHIAAAHSTKKVTRGRMRVSHSLPRFHRKLTIKQLIKVMQ